MAWWNVTGLHLIWVSQWKYKSNHLTKLTKFFKSRFKDNQGFYGAWINVIRVAFHCVTSLVLWAALIDHRLYLLYEYIMKESSRLSYFLYRSFWVYLFFLPSFELLTLSESASKERLCYLKLFLPLWLFLPPSLPTKGWLISSGAESPFYHLAPFEIGYNDWGSILRFPLRSEPFSYCMCAQAFEEVIANKIGMK